MISKANLKNRLNNERVSRAFSVRPVACFGTFQGEKRRRGQQENVALLFTVVQQHWVITS
jgi:hypothetical protein